MTRLIAALAIACALSTQLAAQNKPLITPKDYGKWELLGAPRLSPRGDWVAAPVARVSEENELRIRGGPRDTTIVVAYGTAPVFSADDKWVAYAIGVSPKERERLTKEKKPIHNAFEARNLATGATIAVSEISTFSFSPDGRFISMSRYAAEGKKTSEVLVQDLANNVRLSFSNVGEQAWADAGSLLALTIDTEGGVGNGVQLYDARSGVMRVLESSATSQYRGAGVAAQSRPISPCSAPNVDKAFKDTAHVLLAWTNVASAEAGGASARSHGRGRRRGFPAGMRIADYRRPSWSRDGRIIYFGVRKREPVADAIKKSEEKVSDVEIWHTNDVRMFAAAEGGRRTRTCARRCSRRGASPTTRSCRSALT